MHSFNKYLLSTTLCIFKVLGIEEQTKDRILFPLRAIFSYFLWLLFGESNYSHQEGPSTLGSIYTFLLIPRGCGHATRVLNFVVTCHSGLLLHCSPALGCASSVSSLAQPQLSQPTTSCGPQRHVPQISPQYKQ